MIDPSVSARARLKEAQARLDSHMHYVRYLAMIGDGPAAAEAYKNAKPLVRAYELALNNKSLRKAA